MAVVLAIGVALSTVIAGTASAHDERVVTEPERTGYPDYRDTGPSVVVCKANSADLIRALPAPVRERNLGLLERCRFNHIQQAVNWVEHEGETGTRIQVLPGVYREEPSRQARAERHGAPLDRPDLAETCARIAEDTDHGDEALTYEEQLTCPHLENLVAVLGDSSPEDDSVGCDSRLCDLQIEGTGTRPYDVVVDGEFDTFLNGLRADRTSGLYLSNFATQHFEFNGIYLIETSGATVDRVEGSFNHEYGFLSFVSFVRYQNCGGQANGDSAIYPGASPNVLAGSGLISRQEQPEFSTEVRNCRSHHNALGYSGTTGNSVHAYRNEFDHNSTGLATDSLFPDHPGTPQNHALWEENLFHSNNVNYVARHAQQGRCTGPLDERDYEDGAVCPAVPLPVGTGLFIAGGNFNWVDGNDFYDNWRQGTYQLWVPAELREQEPVPDAHLRDVCGPDGDQPCPPQETSHWNTYSGNRMAGNVAQGTTQPNGADFGWDLEGQGNCWARSGDRANTSAAGEVTYSGIDTTIVQEDLPAFPGCREREATYSPVSTNALEAGCIEYDPSDNPDPAGCDWFDPLPAPDGRQPAAPTLERLAQGGPVGDSVLASQEGYPTGAPTVVLAAAEEPAEALAAAPLAHARGGPVLLTSGDRLDAGTAEEIERLGATSAVLVGDRESLSPRLAADLRRMGFGGDDIQRLGGSGPAGTAAEIASSMTATDAFVVARDDWRDAGTVGSVAALLERPILLSGRDSLPGPTGDVLARGDIEAVDVVGGSGAVSDGVVDDLSTRLDDVERIGGSDRYEISLNVARFALQAGADPTELWLAGGDDAATGAAGSAAAVDEGVMLLAGDGIGGTPTETWLNGTPNHPEGGATVADILEQVRILGDTSQVGSGVTRDLEDHYGASPGDARGDRSSGAPLWHARMHGEATGSAEVQRAVTGATTLRLRASGLDPGETYTATVQRRSCDADSRPLTFDGGEELGAEVTADAHGVAIADRTVYSSAEAPGSVALRHGGSRVACADLG
ncbi:cell wall-binding repeat-containing protein [Haloechinothrix sp. YIM 98757]|uniref:Cell wall-binding repeat-containing protein n=1 Tax=Haloechinothrix aidingensis TaxID=2752311 RepID=A0A838A8A2_9PSEU|nr:cell wall-binding repeat-containing protein [Haloechinothrix aidingensis]